ncbi:glycoside hydrolase family 30 protein [Novosphingobium terrae]|uniref:glycoside hydrolase family 30 protein n=1 Tax=Novosphingobium terrae TaxID=2726189 RepID=UPI0019803841|nr:glycoside hydrolase family 30 protein [Novosphingobium terrae]
MDRRDMLKLAGTGLAMASSGRVMAQAASPRTAGADGGISWHATTRARAWEALAAPSLDAPAANAFARHVEIHLDTPAQPIEGFGGAFSERGWDALGRLSPALRAQALSALFAEDGAALNLCRTPIGANDLARAWYSYDETPGDFAMARFSIAQDRQALLPFIKAAQAIRPDLRLWASPWSPPTWMKKGGHYAQGPAWPGQPDNGIRPDQLGHEGTDSFIQEPRYFEAYARYFGRYVAAYAQEGVKIGMVMPQNEFNSAQPFPSCCWTGEGLARFIPYLGTEMGRHGVELFFGTLERGNADLLAPAMASPEAARWIKGVGVQWAGKGALEDIRRRWPSLPIWGSEQECGVGTNDWHYARYGWTTLKRYFAAGARTWDYWNLALTAGGSSGWGWPQNALVAVAPDGQNYTLTPDYWLLRHLSAFVKPGARYLPTSSFVGYENQMAFRNPDGSLVLVLNNEMAEPLSVGMMIGNRQITPNLPPDSFNTLYIPANLLS